MSQIVIKNAKTKTELTVGYNFPAKVSDAVEMYGEEVVFNRFMRQINQELRASVTRSVEAHIAKCKNDKDKADPQSAAQAAASNFKPSITSGTSKAVRTIDKALGNLSEEDRAAVLKALNATSGGDEMAAAPA